MQCRFAMAFVVAPASPTTFVAHRAAIPPFILHATRDIAPTNKAEAAHKPDTMLEKVKRELPDNLIESAQNMEAILGTPTEDTLLKMLSMLPEQRDKVLSWKDIRRGRDLFFKDCGSFNIMDAYAFCISEQAKALRYSIMVVMANVGLRKICEEYGAPEKEMNYTECDNFLEQNVAHVDFFHSVLRLMEFDPNPAFFDLSRSWWFHENVPDSTAKEQGMCYHFRSEFHKHSTVSIHELRMAGYFVKEEEDAKNSYASYIFWYVPDSPMRQHFIKFMASWTSPQNRASLGKLFHAVIMYILNRTHSWPNQWESMEPELLLERMREMERERNHPFVAFDHLDSLPDQGQMRVLRSNHDILQAGKDLKNCAWKYVKNVKNKKAVLVVLDKKNKPGQPKALGMIEYDGPDVSGTWSQIYLSCNREPSINDKKSFYDYEPTFHEWHRKQYPGNGTWTYQYEYEYEEYEYYE